MERDLRAVRLHSCHHAEICGNHRVDAAVCRLPQKCRKRREICIPRQHICRQINLDAAGVCILHSLPQRVKIKILCSGAHTVFLRADINRVCTELQRGVKALAVARGCQKLRDPCHQLPSAAAAAAACSCRTLSILARCCS